MKRALNALTFLENSFTEKRGKLQNLPFVDRLGTFQRPGTSKAIPKVVEINLMYESSTKNVNLKCLYIVHFNYEPMLCSEI